MSWPIGIDIHGVPYMALYVLLYAECCILYIAWFKNVNSIPGRRRLRVKLASTKPRWHTRTPLCKQGPNTSGYPSCRRDRHNKTGDGYCHLSNIAQRAPTMIHRKDRANLDGTLCHHPIPCTRTCHTLLASQSASETDLSPPPRATLLSPNLPNPAAFFSSASVLADVDEVDDHEAACPKAEHEHPDSVA